MNQWQSSLLAALAAVALTACGLRLRDSWRTQEAYRLIQANYQLRLKQQARPGAAALAPVPEQAAVPVRRGVQAPRENDYRYEGQATPLATLQTLAWACDRSDTDALRRLLCFDPAARLKVESYLAGLPESARAQWRTPEDMAAGVFSAPSLTLPFPDARVLATATEEQVGDGRIRLRLPDTPKDRTEYQRTGEGWKYVITEAMVDAYFELARTQGK